MFAAREAGCRRAFVLKPSVYAPSVLDTIWKSPLSKSLDVLDRVSADSPLNNGVDRIDSSGRISRFGN